MWEFKLGQSYRNLQWVWPVLATRRSTCAVALVAVTNNVAPLVLLVFGFHPGLWTVEGAGLFHERLLMMVVNNESIINCYPPRISGSTQDLGIHPALKNQASSLTDSTRAHLKVRVNQARAQQPVRGAGLSHSSPQHTANQGVTECHQTLCTLYF